jgi:hypothetical protein
MTWRGSSEEVMTKVPMARQTMTLADILQNLKSYDEEPFDCQDPTIYAAEPWTAHSQAVVSWSMPKGGLPEDAAKLRLMCLIEVRKAIGLLADQYDQLLRDNRLEELCQLLVSRVQQLHANPTKPDH